MVLRWQPFTRPGGRGQVHVFGHGRYAGTREMTEKWTSPRPPRERLRYAVRDAAAGPVPGGYRSHVGASAAGCRGGPYDDSRTTPRTRIRHQDYNHSSADTSTVLEGDGGRPCNPVANLRQKVLPLSANAGVGTVISAAIAEGTRHSPKPPSPRPPSAPGRVGRLRLSCRPEPVPELLG
jgi:hypothetical protein